jgi:hypothetical protein
MLRQRFSGWGYKTDGDGWKLLQERSIQKPGKNYCGTSYGVVRLSGIGAIGLRGRARFTVAPKTAEVLGKGEKMVSRDLVCTIKRDLTNKAYLHVAVTVTVTVTQLAGLEASAG